MRAFERTLLWLIVIALAIFTLVVNNAVSHLKTTVQEETSKLAKPKLQATLFPGVPAALANRWRQATKDKPVKSQDYLWLTLHITNRGYSRVENMSSDLALASEISDVYPYHSASSWNAPKVTAGGKGKMQVKVSFPALSQGEAHTMFIALRPKGMNGPPYDAQVMRRWLNQYQLYWKKLTITAGENTTFEQYGLASSWTPGKQHVTK